VSGAAGTVAIVGVIAALVVLTVGAPYLFLVPIFAVVLLVVVGGPALRFFVERGQPGTDEPGVPSTREASYEPVEPRRPTEQ